MNKEQKKYPVVKRGDKVYAHYTNPDRMEGPYVVIDWTKTHGPVVDSGCPMPPGSRGHFLPKWSKAP